MNDIDDSSPLSANGYLIVVQPIHVGRVMCIVMVCLSATCASISTNLCVIEFLDGSSRAQRLGLMMVVNLLPFFLRDGGVNHMSPINELCCSVVYMLENIWLVSYYEVTKVCLLMSWLNLFIVMFMLINSSPCVLWEELLASFVENELDSLVTPRLVGVETVNAETKQQARIEEHQVEY